MKDLPDIESLIAARPKPGSIVVVTLAGIGDVAVKVLSFDEALDVDNDDDNLPMVVASIMGKNGSPAFASVAALRAKVLDAELLVALTSAAYLINSYRREGAVKKSMTPSSSSSPSPLLPTGE